MKNEKKFEIIADYVATLAGGIIMVLIALIVVLLFARFADTDPAPIWVYISTASLCSGGAGVITYYVSYNELLNKIAKAEEEEAE